MCLLCGALAPRAQPSRAKQRSAPRLLAARNLTDYTAADRDTIYLGTYTRPDRCRGIDITFALLLDADEASYRHLMATYRALSGTVNTLQSPDPFIIVHTINIEPVWAFIPYIKTCNPSVPALPAPPPPTPPPIPPEPKPPAKMKEYRKTYGVD